MTRDAAREEAVHRALGAVEDPEVPVTLRDLGVLRDVAFDGDRVTVRLVPTRVGCPARDVMARRVRDAARSVDPDLDFVVEWDLRTWTARDVSAGGCAALRGAGYAVGPAGIRCPYCDATDVRRDGSYGGSLCKRPYSCRACGSTFELLRSAEPEPPI